MSGSRPALATLASAWWRTRRLARLLRTRDDVERWQATSISRWLADAVPKAPFYAARRATRLEELPIVDKAILMNDFGSFNRVGLTRDAGGRIFDGEEAAPDGVDVGASTGTSGTRGLYVISRAERYEWLGVIMAKALPRYPFEGARIALMMPQASALYGSVRHAPRLSLRFFDLREGMDSLSPAVRGWSPDTLIGPPKALRRLADEGGLPRVRRVFSGAEVLDPPDRSSVEAAFGVRVREIYMATEGLFGVACPHGALHLAEDAVHFEWEPVGSDGLVSPIVTDFTRRTQIMARYRMNDLLRLSSTPCPCGSPLRAVAEVVGRADDVLSLPSIHGLREVEITPDVLRNAVLDADRRIDDFRLVQVARDRIELALPEGLAGSAMAARLGVESLLARVGARATVENVVGTPPAGVGKLRRIERRWRG